MNDDRIERRGDDRREASRALWAWLCAAGSGALLLGGVVASFRVSWFADLGPVWLPPAVILAFWSAVQAQPFARAER